MKLEILNTYNVEKSIYKAKLIGVTTLDKEKTLACLLYHLINEETGNEQLVNITIRKDSISGLHNKKYEDRVINLYDTNFTTDWFYIKNNSWSYLNPFEVHSTDEIFA